MEQDDYPATKKSPGAAFAFSLFAPGFGYLYVLRPVRAALFVGAFFALTASFFTGIAGRTFASLCGLLAIAIPLVIFSVIDAVMIADRPHLRNRWYGRWYVVLALVVAYQLTALPLLQSVQVLKSFRIPTASMEPTIRVGERIVASMQRDPRRPFRRNDLIIISPPDALATVMIKRIVALPGDTIAIHDKVVLLNGQRSREPWAIHTDPTLGDERSDALLRARDQLAPFVVPSGSLFVMGDNRDRSNDSRFVGPVPVSFVRGTPLYVYWSPDRSRIGRRLDVE